MKPNVHETDLYDHDAVGLAAAIRAGRVSPMLAVTGFLDRIETIDPAIRAWVEVDRDRAISAARELTAEAERGRFRGPLHGVPIGVKDIFDVAGLRTRAGAPFLESGPAAEDAEVVAGLRRAGAVVVGKTATTQLAYLDPADTRNPWDLARSPGGSSSGSAAAVAARMAPLALGSQTGGSTLRPAAFCGVVGLKPTYGRLSCRGMLPLAWSMDHVGIIARTVRDVALVFQVLDGGRPGGRSAPAEDVSSAAEPVAKPRLGLVRRFGSETGDDEVMRHLDAAAETLGRAGARVEEVELPPSVGGVQAARAAIEQAEAAAVHGDAFARRRDEYRPRIRALIEEGLRLPAIEYVRAQRHRSRFREDLAPLLDRVDALLTPMGGPAPPFRMPFEGPNFCAPWSFAGCPALSLPAGLGRDGLPRGVQLVAAPFAETRLLSVARWCERAMPFSAAP